MSRQPDDDPDRTLSESLLPSSSPLPPVTLSVPLDPGMPITQFEDANTSVAQPERKMLGRFEIHGEIGRGGMGAVLRGYDPALGRDLAIKVLLAGREGNADARRRFHDEAQIGGQLEHPGLVPVYELGADADGSPFFAMKLVYGRTLATLLKERAAPADDMPRFLTIFEQVCQALAYAHARGVIHRDLKPANIMVGAFGEVQVMDWGLAKVMAETGRAERPAQHTVHMERTESGSTESRDGSVLGSPAYMPPEQARGEIDRLDQRADVFGLGAILCEILTGQPPFMGKNVSEILGHSANGQLTESFARLDGCGADAELIALAQRSLAPQPEARPRDGSEVAAKVAAYRAGVEARLRRAELERAAAEVRAVEEQRRRRAQLALAGTLLLLLTLGGGGGWWLRHQQLERQQEQVRHDTELREQRLQREADQARLETERLQREGELTRAVEDDLHRLAQARQERNWDAAEKVLERIEGRLGQGGGAEMRQRVVQARADLAQVRKDQQMVARLDEARLQLAASGDKGFDAEGSRKRFSEAFTWYGLDVREGSPDALAARIKDSPIREEVLLALDRWSVMTGPAEAQRLRTIADGADDSAWRRQLRGAILLKDYDVVRRLADEAKVDELRPASIVILADALREAKAPERGIDLLREGRQLHPADFLLNYDLALTLNNATPPQIDEAVRYYTVAQALRPDSVDVQNNFAWALQAQGKYAEAVATHRVAIRLKPDYFAPHNDLGYALKAQGKLPEAIVEFREAIRLKPDYFYGHMNLGNTLQMLDQYAEAAAEFRTSIRLRPNNHFAHNNLGIALQALGQLPAAAEAYRECIRVRPDYTFAYFNLAWVLRLQNKPSEAEAIYREVLRLDLKASLHFAHYHLASMLQSREDYPAAAAEYREAVRLKPDYAAAHYALGFVLRQQGQFESSRDAYRRGHELGSKLPDWNYPSEEDLREAERLVELDRRLPDILDGKAKPANAAELLEFVQVCVLKRRFSAAARLSADAFTADPKMANDLSKQHRYNAACYAVVAAAGVEEGGKPSTDDERTQLRKQALGWLRDDLTAWSKRLVISNREERALVGETMRHWQGDADLAAVRDAAAVAKLSEAERAAWQKLWQDVEVLLKRAGESK